MLFPSYDIKNFSKKVCILINISFFSIFSSSNQKMETLKLTYKDHIATIENSLDTYLNTKIPDCILYSNGGSLFKIHKEVLSQTSFLREILSSAKENCCRFLEILCPCSKEELGQIVNFLYYGEIYFTKESESIKIQDSLHKIFGFPENFNPTSSNQAFHGGQNCSNEIGAVTKNETDKEGDY